MAKISTYVIDGYIVDGDKVIGSDANNDMVTKNYTVGDLVAYFAASIGGNYLVPYIGANDDVDLGSFDITANDLITTNSIFAGGTEGLANQVLTSQGPGLPTIWAYNSGTQNLQSVLSYGNTANNSITLTNPSYSINLNQTTGTISLSDIANSRVGYINTGAVHLVGATSVADYYHNGVVYTSGANTISVLTNVFNNQTIRYPSAGGVLALSVNGVSADITGEITIPVGSAQNLQQVTDVGNVTTNPITIATQLNITQSGYTGSLSTFANGLTGPTDWDLPNQSGTLVISVNGIAADSGGNINITSGGVSGSGTTNYIPKWSGATSLSNSQIFDNGTTVGIGTATPSGGILDVVGISKFSSNTNGAFDNVISIENSGTGTYRYAVLGIGTLYSHPSGTNLADIRLSNSNTTGIRIYASNSELTNIPSGAGFQFFNNADPTYTGKVFFDSGADDNAAIIWRTAQTANPITERMRLDSVGDLTISNLATGGVDEMVTVDSSGKLNKQTIPSSGISGSGTTDYIPKWSGSTSLSDSTIFDNGTSVGIGTATPNATYKLDVNGIIQTQSGINLSASSGVKTGIYSGSNQFTFWAGNNQLATYRLNGNLAGSFFEHTAGFTNTGTTTGDQNVWRLAGSVTATTAVNTMNTNQLIINPTYNQQTFGTGILRGVYYNPTISNLNSSQHTAWENTSGDIIHANLGGGGTQMVVADNAGKLGVQAIPTGTSPLTTKGDLYTYDTSDARLPVGLDTQVLIADSTTATGLKWGSNTAPTPLGYYAQYQDDLTQTIAVINTGYPIKFRTLDISNGVTVVSDSRITFANTGIYNLQFSVQLENSDTQEHDVTIWLRKNGADVTGSAGFVAVVAKHGGINGHIISSWNYLLDVVGGEYYELVWSATSTQITMPFIAAGSPPPSTASAIFTVTQQAGIMAGTGITAINSLTGAVQTLATGTSGTNFAISSSGTTHTFNLPTASATNTGKLSNTDWNTFNTKGYTVALTSGTATPVNNTTYYFGNNARPFLQNADALRVYIPKTGTIKRADIVGFATVAGTAENISLYVRLNATTDTLIATVGVASTRRVFSNSSLNIPVSAGDYIEIKMVSPTWVTAPTTLSFGGMLWIE